MANHRLYVVNMWEVDLRRSSSFAYKEEALSRLYAPSTFATMSAKNRTVITVSHIGRYWYCQNRNNGEDKGETHHVTPCFYIVLDADHPLQVSNRLRSAHAIPADCHLTSTIPGPCRGSSTLLHGGKVPSLKPTSTSSHTNALNVLAKLEPWPANFRMQVCVLPLSRKCTS